ncbi:Long-chain-fatty-acid--AMP ligase FadD30 [Mycobacterium basiliense]|uniref:Long-chain-fatty-acid--AMP ligase FadD30 n=1 Tax=Mycobacterium basiliense TaxID=2094119 RepID=A0A447G979_9MYCO|nr:AMP-binding protein [Mycobacterium basiliense]VDM87053.1 Long-chain-fatty-acid--AMP ligase FadD30 [Mycobacterium basiliense]
MPIISTLRDRANTTPDREAFRFFDYAVGDEPQIDTLTWQELYARTTALAKYLASFNGHFERQRFAAISAPQGLDYIVGFLGALRAGWIPVPLPEPQGSLQDKRTGLVLADCSADAVLTTVSAEDAIRATLGSHHLSATTPVIALDALDDPCFGAPEDRDAWAAPQFDTGSYLQYTSGSTGNPKGARLSVHNVVENTNHILRDLFTAEDQTQNLPGSVVSWLPLYHDMGLMTNLFIPVLTGCPSTIMSPASFIRKPARWLQLVAQNDTPFTAAPNFAFDLAAARISDKDMAGRDLAHVSAMANGGERVQAGTIERFLDKFRPYNLKPTAVRPAYGMAEAVVYLATTKYGSSPTSTVFDSKSLTRGCAEPGTDKSSLTSTLVRYHRSGSQPLIRIVDPESQAEVEPGRIGEIWAHGANLSTGYHGAESQLNKDKFHAAIREPSAATPRSPWLRTGDLGFAFDEEFYIVGRIKDLVIQDGVNHYPEDIENTVNKFTGSRVASFSVPGELGENLIIAAEVKVEKLADESIRTDLSRMKKQVLAALSRLHGLRVTDFLLVPHGSLPKTTSGKISRAACAMRYESAELERIETLQ